MIWCDPVRLQSLFFHIVKNAVHRSPALVPIDVMVDISERKEHLYVRVIDRGKAIPVSELPHVFETFENLRTYGSGMGLAICKGLVAAFRGQIWVETTQDAYTSFSFTLPIHPDRFVPMRTRMLGEILSAKEAYSQDDEAGHRL
jgi:signal transduction histidine kinase